MINTLKLKGSFAAFFAFGALIGVASIASNSGAAELLSSDSVAVSAGTSDSGIDQNVARDPDNAPNASIDTGITDDNGVTELGFYEKNSENERCVQFTCQHHKDQAKENCKDNRDGDAAHCGVVSDRAWSLCKEERRCEDRYKSR